MPTDKLLKFCLAVFLVSCASEKTKVEAPVLVKKQHFHVLTLDNMSDYQGSVLEYVMNASKLKTELDEALHRARELCKQDDESACKDMAPIKAQREDLHQGLIDVTWVKACATQDAILERKRLTKKTDPRLQKELKVYSEAHKRESGKAVDLSKCE